MNKIKVSVCIPVYGVEKYIERCARSLFEQTMEEGIEFIFVDDCTQDKSISVLQRILEEYPHRKEQVIILHHEENKGLSGARNTSLAVAKGNYIIHCDSDDWVGLDMYEKMYRKAIETDADMVYCSFFVCWDNGKQKEIPMKEYPDVDAMIQDIFYSTQFNSLTNKLFRREIALSTSLEVPNHICNGEDFLRVSQMLMECKKPTYCPDVFYYYQKNKDSITMAFNRQNYESLFEVINILKNKLGAEYFDRFGMIYRNILRESIIYNQEAGEYFLSLWEKKYWINEKINIFRDRNLRWEMKVLLYVACISYRLSCLLFNLVQRKY